MKTIKIILAVLAGAVIGTGIIYATGNFFAPQAPTGSYENKNQNNSKWEPKIDSQADVDVEVTPVDLSANTDEWKFYISLNTHSVDIGQDISAVSALFDEKRNEYKALRWEGSPAGGHHRSGMLVFKAIKPAPKSIELKIEKVGDVTRSFTWNL